MKKLFSLLLVSVLTTAIASAQDVPPPPPAPQGDAVPPAPRQEKPAPDATPAERKMSPRKQNFLMWRAFSQLSEEERTMLVKLQREDPEQFRTILRGKAEALFAAEQKRQEELRGLLADYNRTSDEKIRAEIKSKVRSMLAEDFRNHLNESTAQLQEMKRRAAELESELAKRAANAEAAIDAQTEAVLAGKFFPGDRPPREFRDDRPKRPNPDAPVPPPPPAPKP